MGRRTNNATTATETPNRRSHQQLVMAKILIIGDSWASAYVATETGDIDRDGWPKLLGIPDEMRQGIAGSTAAQWAADFGGNLTRAIQTEADVVIISLLGNDAFAVINSGQTSLPAVFGEIAAGVDNFRKVVESVRKPRTIVIQYTDPFSGNNPMSAVACPLLDAFIKGEVPDGVEVFDTRTVLKPEHFNGHDIHPNMAGHQAIADKLRQLLSLP
jgi:lysophospholipase L1-like esterase